MKAPFVIGIGVSSVAALLLAGNLSNSPQTSESTCKLPGLQCSKPGRQKVFVQLVLQPSTPESALVTEDLLHLLSKRVRPKHFVEISRLSSTGNVEVLYSATATKQAMQAMHWEVDSKPDTVELDPTPSPDDALVNGTQRLRDRIKALPSGQELHFYLVTEGTANPEIISQLKAVTSSFAGEELSQVHIYVIGLSEQNRLALSNAFTPVENNVYFAGQDPSEWMPLVRNF